MHPFRHLATIVRHRHIVFRHAVHVGITWQGLTHDLSKFSPVEFWQGARHFTGTASPNEGERETRGYSLAWMHHKGRNRHHIEWWVDINPATRVYEPVEIPTRYLAEMFCDRVAASKVYRGEQYTDGFPLAYFLRGHARSLMHPASAALLESWLTTLATEGERTAHATIKQAVKEAKKQKHRQPN